MFNPIDWSALLQCRLLSPLRPCVPNASCLGSIFPSQLIFSQFRPDSWWQAANGSLRPAPKSLTLFLAELWACSHVAPPKHVCHLSSDMWSRSGWRYQGWLHGRTNGWTHPLESVKTCAAAANTFRKVKRLVLAICWGWLASTHHGLHIH